MKTAIIIVGILATILINNANAAPNKVVCYYESWATYRKGQGKFDAGSINPKLCTHLIYSFVGIGDDGSVKVLDAWNDLDNGLGGFKHFVELKNKAPGLKTMVAVGGWNAGAATFSKVAGSDSLRGKFVANVVQFLQKYKFDGFDVDWEYPANSAQGGHPQDKTNFSKLIQQLKAAFGPHGFVLSAAVAAAPTENSNYYEIPQLSKYLDFINVMAYDMHGSGDGKTGINAPLYGSSGNLNVDASIESWIKKGADPKKLVLGMGTYGRSFTLADPNNHGIGAPTTGPGNAGKYTGGSGTLGYNEIVELLKGKQMTSVWVDDEKVPYAYGGNQWVGYDNPRSIQLKCDYAKQKGLGGGMVWSIDTDDFHGVSGTKFALLTTINKAFGRNV